MIPVTQEAGIARALFQVAGRAGRPVDGGKVRGEGEGIIVLVSLGIVGRGLQGMAGQAAFLVQQAKMGRVREYCG